MKDIYNFLSEAQISESNISQDINNFKDIKTLDEVKDFFKWLVQNDLLIHPDDDFNDLNYNNRNVITKKQAFDLNNIMERCFDICNKYNDEDLIYDIAMKAAYPPDGIPR